MANFATNESTLVLVGKDAALTDTPADRNALADGEISCYKLGNTKIIETGSTTGANEAASIIEG